MIPETRNPDFIPVWWIKRYVDNWIPDARGMIDYMLETWVEEQRRG